MDKFASGIHQKIYFDKLQHLLFSKTFNDITFNCKDGKTSANRLILSVYSNFLSDIFKENPLLIEHPVYGHPESGINLPEIVVKDVENLLKVLNTSNYVEMSKDLLKGLQYVAKQLQIELIVDKVNLNSVRIQALPKQTEGKPLVKPVNLVKDVQAVVSEKKSTSKFIYQGKEFTAEEDLNETESELLPQIKMEPKSENEQDELDFEEDEEDRETPFGISQDLSQMSLPTFSDPEADMLSEKGICPICHVTCKSKTGVQIHIGHAHRDIDELQAVQDEEKSNIICKCGKTFSKHSKNLLRNHRQKCPAFRKAAFICEICESPFISMPALTTHLIAIHGITKEANSCICGQTFGSRGSCRKHAITCQAYKNAAIFCKDCNLPFLTNGHLKQHLRTPSHRNMAKKRRLKALEV